MLYQRFILHAAVDEIVMSSLCSRHVQMLQDSMFPTSEHRFRCVHHCNLYFKPVGCNAFDQSIIKARSSDKQLGAPCIFNSPPPPPLEEHADKWSDPRSTCHQRNSQECHSIRTQDHHQHSLAVYKSTRITLHVVTGVIQQRQS